MYYVPMHRFSYRKWKYFIDLRKIERIFGLISELLGNILKKVRTFQKSPEL